jgi:hypothetical protein
MEIVGTEMNNKLADNINTFFNNSRTTISSLVRDMKLDKADFMALIKKINSSSNFNDFIPAQIINFSEIQKEPVIDLFRDSSLRISRLFSATNASGLVIDSLTNIMSADIEKIEEDIKNLQIFIDNYEFLAGKDDLYTGNYIEKFDNSLNDYKSDGYDFLVPDRDNSSFPISGNIYIDSLAGLMKMGSGHSISNVINNIKSINLVKNYNNYISSESNFVNVFTDSLADSWNTTIKSPVLLNSDLTDYAHYIQYDSSMVAAGAKVAVEINLHSAIDVDTIRLSPNLGNGLQLLQVVLFQKLETDGITDVQISQSEYKLILDAPKIINSSTELLFEKFRTNKMILIFNQSSYTRSKKPSLISELNSKSMNDFVMKRIEENRSKFSKYQDIVYWFFNRKFTVSGIKKNYTSDIEYYSYRFPESLRSYAKYVEQEFIKASNFSIADNPVFVNSPIFLDLINSMFNTVMKDKKFLSLGPSINTRSYGMNSANLGNPGFLTGRATNDMDDPKYQFYLDGYTPTISNDLIRSLFVEETSDVYEYSFSMKSIEFLSTIYNQVSKSCFVSKKIPVNGQVLGVKAKVQIVNDSINSLENKYDLNKYTSYELSVSNIDYPISETDWMPIAFNNSNFIDSEVVFFDISNFSASLRFPPKADSVILYKDGMLMSASAYEYRTESNRLILKNIIEFNPSSIFVASYTIDDTTYDPYQLDLLKANAYQESVKQYRNKNGVGQIFDRTSGNDTVKIDFIPYVNTATLTGAGYDQFFGTIFANSFTGYSPVKVKLADGSYAFNLTNYTRTPKKVSFSGTETVQFIQTGKDILFNQPIDRPFTVQYEYVPYSLRFRFVMRRNILGVEIPARADSVLLKLKTAHFDPYYDKLVYVARA